MMTSETTPSIHIEDHVLRRYISQIRLNSDLEVNNYVADATIRYDQTLPLSTVFSELVRKVNDT